MNIVNIYTDHEDNVIYVYMEFKSDGNCEHVAQV